MIERIPIPSWMKFAVIKQNILEYGDFTCEYCFGRLRAIEIVFDHYTPVSMGGETIEENLGIACQKCNNKKRDKDYHAYTSSIRGFVHKSDVAHFRRD